MTSRFAGFFGASNAGAGSSEQDREIRDVVMIFVLGGISPDEFYLMQEEFERQVSKISSDAVR